DTGNPLVRRVGVRVHKPAAPVGLPVDDVTVSIERDAPPVPAVLALGTNLGDRAEHLRAALELLAGTEGIEVDWTGPVRQTAPRAERAARRERLVRWGPRTLDVDVITYGDWTSQDETLTVPHPRAHLRAFVLAPWHAARPDAELPGHGPLAPLLAAAADREGLRPGPEVEGYGIP